jgi:putative transposase
MKKSRYTAEQVAYALRLAESGTPVADVCRQTGIADATVSPWKEEVRQRGRAGGANTRSPQEAVESAPR